MTTPTRTVWIATFVGLVLSIGLLAGIIVERKWLSGHEPGMRGPGPGPGQGFGGSRGGGGRRGGGPGGPGGPMGGPDRGLFGAPPEMYVDDLAREFTLSADQRAAILELLKAQETRLRDQQEQARQTFISEQQALHDRIAAALTPEQATKFRAWVERRTGPGRGRGR